MKKNLITVIILALVVVNLVLTAILTITIIPETQKANELITRVCSAIDLDLQAGDTAGSLSVSIDQLSTYDIADSMTINLASNGDGASHYAVLNVSISMDTSNDQYETFGSGDLSTYESLIKSEIITIVSSHTIDEMKTGSAAVQEEIVEDLQTLFASNFIVGVSFSSAVYQ